MKRLGVKFVTLVVAFSLLGSGFLPILETYTPRAHAQPAFEL